MALLVWLLLVVALLSPMLLLMVPILNGLAQITDHLTGLASRIVFDAIKAVNEFKVNEIERERKRVELIYLEDRVGISTEASRAGLVLGQKHGELGVLERFDRMEAERARARMELRRQRQQLRNGGE